MPRMPVSSRDVQPLERQEPQQPQADLVAEQPVERGGILHITNLH